MRYAVISDIHGNLEALNSVIDSCHSSGVDSFICAGDIVGYGANPRECLDIIRELRIISVAGNHDLAVAGKIDASYFIPAGKAAIAWCRNVLSFEDFDFLNGLPLVLKNNYLIVVHASLHHPERFEYLYDIINATDTFYLMDRSVCFIGHTHRPQIFIQKDGRLFFPNELSIELSAGCKYIVNVGSVGQPRDSNPMACYCIYDTDLNMIEVKRVAYDIKSAQRKIIEAGLPEILAYRLSTG